MNDHFSNDLFKNKKLSYQMLQQYPLIGDGKDGEVYQIDEDQCVKWFFQKETHKRELEALQAGQTSPVIPHLYGYGENFIVMEFVRGISFSRHLKVTKHISIELTERVLQMLDELKKIGFTRIDTEVRHILMNENDELKVIDHKRAFTSNSPVPKKLLKGLQKLGLADDFLQHVKTLRPTLYEKWRKG